VEANLHVQWDLYGSFCFVPTEEDAINMLRELRTSNDIWQKDQLEEAIFRLFGPAPRPLDVHFITLSFITNLRL
jgi:hypothetical protein